MPSTTGVKKPISVTQGRRWKSMRAVVRNIIARPARSRLQGQLEVEPEAAADAGLAEHLDPAAHQAHQLLADGQAQAGAARTAGILGHLLEGLEQAAGLGRVHGDAGVADLDA